MTKRHRFRNHETRIKLVGGELLFNIEGKGLNRWLDRLDHFATAAKDMQPVFDEFGRYMMNSIDRNFAAEGRPDSWQPLAEATIRERIRQGYGASPILHRSGKLQRGFRMQTGKTFLRILNGVPYFQYHQQDDGKGKKLPRRIMVIMLSQDRAQLTRITNLHLTGGRR